MGRSATLRSALNAKVLSPSQLGRIVGLPFVTLVFLLIGLLAVGAAVVLLAIVPGGLPTRSPWLLAIAESVALAGLITGCILLIIGSRHHLLGMTGIFVCGFIAVLLAAFAGLSVHLAATGQAWPLTTALRGHYPSRLPTVLALAGLLAALLLVATPWSPYRIVVQPCLVVVAVLLPTLALLQLPVGQVRPVNPQGLVQVGGFEPLLVVGLVAGLLAAPIAVASSIVWVSACVGAGFWVADHAEGRPHWVKVAFLIESLWLALGTLRILPVCIGGRLGAWSLIRSAHIDAWLVCVFLTVLGCIVVIRRKTTDDLPEMTRVSYVPTGIISFCILAVALIIFMQAVRVVANAAVPTAAPSIVINFCIFAFAVTLIWTRTSKWRCYAWATLGVLAVSVATVVSGLLWTETKSAASQVGKIQDPVYSAVGKVLGSAVFLILVAGITCLGCVGVWVCMILLNKWAGRNVNRKVRRGSEDSNYGEVLLPLACWSAVVVGGALLRVVVVGGPITRISAFSSPVAPDPVLFALVAFPVAAVIAAGPMHVSKASRDVALTAALVLPVLAFLPFAVPPELAPNGRLAAIALVAPLAYSATLGARSIIQEPGHERRICWLIGTSAVVLPLLAYVAVAAGQHESLTGLLSDSGHGAAGVGPTAHLRVLLLIPIFLTLICVRRRSSDRPTKHSRSAWHDFEADSIVASIQDKSFDDFYVTTLKNHLANLDENELVAYAVALAARLCRSYELRRTKRPKQEQIEELQTPARALPSRATVDRVLRLAQRITTEDPPTARRLARARSLVTGPFAGIDERERSDKRNLTALRALRCALHHPEHSPKYLIKELTALSRHEVENASHNLLYGPQEGAQYEYNLTKAHIVIGEQLASLPGNFSVFEDVLPLLWPMPALVLDDPPRRRYGFTNPVKHPYWWLGVLLISVVSVATLIYVLLQAILPPP